MCQNYLSGNNIITYFLEIDIVNRVYYWVVNLKLWIIISTSALFEGEGASKSHKFMCTGIERALIELGGLIHDAESI